jgi:hypothetical protein
LLRCFKREGSRCKMGSADLPEAAATCQQTSYTVSLRCAVFVFRHANLHTTGISEAARDINVLRRAAKP